MSTSINVRVDVKIARRDHHISGDTFPKTPPIRQYCAYIPPPENLHANPPAVLKSQLPPRQSLSFRHARALIPSVRNYRFTNRLSGHENFVISSYDARVQREVQSDDLKVEIDLYSRDALACESFAREFFDQSF